MAEKEATAKSGTAAEAVENAGEKKARKDVPGNFSYSFTPNRFKEAL
jgi:hypothetical protein